MSARRHLCVSAVLSCLTVACGVGSTEPPPAPDERVEWGTRELPATQCVGDADGVITADELVFAPGLAPTAAFLVDPPESQPSLPGSRWDLDWAADGADAVAWLGPEEAGGAWFDGWFPAADFHALTDVGAASRSIYAVSGDSLLMLGVASETPDESVLRYDPAVPVLPLPLQVGDSWTAEVDAEGVHDGQEYPADFGIQGVVTLVHRYSFEVVEFGVLSVPAADLPALRIRVELVTEAHNSFVGLFASESVRLDLMVAECLGVVARIRSLPDEPSADFTVAQEVQRLGFEPELLDP